MGYLPTWFQQEPCLKLSKTRQTGEPSGWGGCLCLCRAVACLGAVDAVRIDGATPVAAMGGMCAGARRCAAGGGAGGERLASRRKEKQCEMIKQCGLSGSDDRRWSRRCDATNDVKLIWWSPDRFRELDGLLTGARNNRHRGAARLCAFDLVPRPKDAQATDSNPPTCASDTPSGSCRDVSTSLRHTSTT